MALALYDDFLHFWEPDSPQFQSAPDEWVFAVEHQLCFVDERQITPQLLADELERALADGRVGRLIQLTDVHTISLCTNRESCNSTIWLRQGKIERWGEFDWGWYDHQLFEWSASDCAEHLEKTIFDGEDYEDTFSYALFNRDIPYFHNALTKVRTVRGTEGQMKKVANLILQLSPDWFEKVLSLPRNEWDAQFILVLKLGQLARYICGGREKKQGITEVPHPNAALWEVWLKYFQPQPDKDFYSEEIKVGYRLFSYNFVNKFHLSNFRWDGKVIYERSQHEHLETRLQLRDWLRDDVGLSSERIAELLA